MTRTIATAASATATSGAGETLALFSAEEPRQTAAWLTPWQRRVAAERRAALVAVAPYLAEGRPASEAARCAGVSPSAISRLLDLLPASPGTRVLTVAARVRLLLDWPMEKLAPPAARGVTSDWEFLLGDEAVRVKLRALLAATMGAASDGATRDRRTGSIAAALRVFGVHPECPAALREALLAGRFPAPLVKFLKQMTPEVESLIRGPKHFQLSGASGWRDRGERKTVGLPDGRRALMVANWTVQWDDMSLNQPYWVLGPDGEPIVCRQSLIARDVATGRWQTVELIARVRDAYTAADILRTVRRYCELYGVPGEIVFEQSVWGSRAIKGWRVEGKGVGIESEVLRPAMAAAERDALAAGIRDLGCKLTYAKSARGKAHLEGGFDTLQTYLPTFTMDLPNMGRHAGEFDGVARELRRVKDGTVHPADAGFPHANELLERVMKCFDFLNGLKGEASPEARYQADQAQWPSRALRPDDAVVFLPDRADATIRELAVWPSKEGRKLCFRSPLFAQLGDGYRVTLRFDATEPSLGAGIYNREIGLRNFNGAVPGAFLGVAAYDPPGATTHAESVPAGVPTWSEEELHGGQADGGNALKQQRKAVKGWVKTAFGGRVPGRAKVVAATSRDGRGAAAEATRTDGGTLPAEPRPVAPAERISAPRRTRTAEEVLAEVERTERTIENALDNL